MGNGNRAAHPILRRLLGFLVEPSDRGMDAMLLFEELLYIKSTMSGI
jgi:hypothetical protein